MKAKNLKAPYEHHMNERKEHEGEKKRRVTAIRKIVGKQTGFQEVNNGGTRTIKEKKNAST